MKVQGFTSQSSESRFAIIDQKTLINLYPEINQGTAKDVVSLIGRPGEKLIVDLGTNAPIRGVHATSTGRMFACSGQKVFEITCQPQNGVYQFASVGDINTTAGTVTFCDNGYFLMVVDGLSAYYYMLQTYDLYNAGVFATVNIDGFKPSTHCFYLNGYFHCLTRDDTMLFSLLEDPSQWDVVDVYSAQSSGGTLAAVKSNGEIWLFGNSGSEAWQDSGNPDNPYQIIRPSISDIGTAAKYSCVTNGTSVFLLGGNAQGNGIVWMSQGYQLARVSTHSIEYQISKMTRISDAIGFCYQQEGHAFYCLHFPSGKKTLVYDMTTGFWHERKYYNSVKNVAEMSRSVYHCFWNNKNYVGDYQNGKIYELNLNFATDNGDKVVRTVTTPHLHDDNRTIRYNKFGIDYNRGDTDILNGEESTPEASLRFSDDGGVTWSNFIQCGLGKVGEYKNLCEWTRLGSAKDRIFEVSISDNYKIAIVNAYMQIN